MCISSTSNLCPSATTFFKSSMASVYVIRWKGVSTTAVMRSMQLGSPPGRVAKYSMSSPRQIGGDSECQDRARDGGWGHLPAVVEQVLTAVTDVVLSTAHVVPGSKGWIRCHMHATGEAHQMSAKEISGSIIQNSARWRVVCESCRRGHNQGQHCERLRQGPQHGKWAQKCTRRRGRRHTSPRSAAHSR